MNTEEIFANVSGNENEESIHVQQDFDWLDYLQNVKDKVSLDVSKQRITYVSDKLFLVCPNLEVSNASLK